MLRIGLTGGIGCGKSTVAVMMGELGCHIINADKMAHALIAPGEPAYDEVIREFDRWAANDPHGVAVVEAALLIEAGYHHKLDRLVLVTCTREQQLERLTNAASGRAMSREQAEKRIAAQMPVEEKRRAGAGKTDEIDCSVSLDCTRKQVQALAAQFRRMAGLPAR